MFDVPAMILAGGLGTRLSRVLPDMPKVLAPIAGRPFLAYLLDALADAGIQEAILCTGYRADSVERAFGARYRGISLRYSRETQPLGTGGALRQAMGMTSADTLLALNGDSFVAYDFQAFLAWHQESNFAASLVLTQVPDCSRFGTVDVTPQGVIRSFAEKTGRAEAGWINGGVYLVSRPLLSSLPQERTLSIERDVFPSWLSVGLGGYRSSGAFLDIGTPESLAQAETFLTGLEAPL
jgi:NDP-sugar pyrophosphorylase family protein